MDNRKNIRFEDDIVGINMQYWEKRICPICGKIFYCRKKYDKITCSNECYKEYITIHKIEINKKRSEKLKKVNELKPKEVKQQEIEKAKKTCLERYGVDNWQKQESAKLELSMRFKAKDWSERSRKVNELLKPKYYNICKEDDLELIEFRNRFDCTVKCKKCGNIFDIHVLGYLTEKTNHNLCRHCYPNVNSTSETYPLKFIEKILNDNNIVYYKNDRTIIKPYEIDIYIEALKIGIEVNGNYWHSEFSCGKNKKYHITKTKLAQEKGVKLIQIFEDEIINKPKIVESRIKNLIGITQKRIYARKCVIKEIDSKTKKEFLKNNHIDGDAISKYNIGLYYDNDLVSVATFGLRKISKKKQFELIRFASLINTNVIGAFSKILKYFIKTYKPLKLVTYADIRWSGININDNVYVKNGFKFDSITSPNYFYEDKKEYLCRINRLNFTKQKLIKRGFDANKTEIEIMVENGYDRIWDCGSMKFIFT